MGARARPRWRPQQLRRGNSCWEGAASNWTARRSPWGEPPKRTDSQAIPNRPAVHDCSFATPGQVSMKRNGSSRNTVESLPGRRHGDMETSGRYYLHGPDHGMIRADRSATYPPDGLLARDRTLPRGSPGPLGDRHAGSLRLRNRHLLYRNGRLWREHGSKFRMTVEWSGGAVWVYTGEINYRQMLIVGGITVR